MANNSVLKAAIADVVKQNGTNEITGDLLQQSLLSMIDALGGNYQYAGIATPTTNPGTPDQNVFYLAATAGTYTNFGGIVLAAGEVSVIKGSGSSWTKDATRIVYSQNYCILLGSTSLPNIDTSAMTMTFPNDSGFYCKGCGVLQPINFTVSIGATSGGGSRILYFNAETRTLHLEVHTFTPAISDFVVGAIKLRASDYTYLRSDFPFEYTIDGKNNFLFGLPSAIKKNNYCVLLGSQYLPNIDTSAKTMTFPNDSGFYCNYYGVLQPINFTVSIGATSGGGSRILYFNAETRTLHLEVHTFTPAISDFIVGAIKLRASDYTYLRSDFPFEYTIDGVSNFIKQEVSQTYTGRDISLKHKIAVSTVAVTNPSALSNAQGMAIYENFLVRCNDNMACVAIYNATTFELLYTLTPSSQQPDLHCNTVSFGIEKYDSSDPLPLLYCPAERNSNIYVYRILPDFSGFVLVQTIDISVFASHPYYYPNGIVDVQNKKLVLTGWNKHESGKGNNLDPDAYIGVAVCKLPLLSDGDTAITSSDIEKTFEYPAITVTQGAQVINGRLYQACGLPGLFTDDPYVRLGVIDINEEQVVNILVLNNYGVTAEPEGLAVKDGVIYIDFRSQLVALSF